METQVESKSQIVKRLATLGQFQKCENDYGAKAADKAREYVLSKILHYRKLSIDKLIEDGGLSDFMMFAVKSSDQDNVDIIASMYAAQLGTAVQSPRSPPPSTEVVAANAASVVSPMVTEVESSAMEASPPQLPSVSGITEEQLSHSPPSTEVVAANAAGVVSPMVTEVESPAMEASPPQSPSVNGITVVPADNVSANTIEVDLSIVCTEVNQTTPSAKSSKFKPVSGTCAPSKSSKKSDAKKRTKGVGIAKSKPKSKPKDEIKEIKSTAEHTCDINENECSEEDSGCCDTLLGKKQKSSVGKSDVVKNAALLSDKEFEKLICKPRKKHKKEVEWAPEYTAEVHYKKQSAVHNHLKQADLPPELDLKNMRACVRARGAFAADSFIDMAEDGVFVGVGKLCYLLLPAYREFISRFPRKMLDNFTVDDGSGVELFEAVQEICCCSLTHIELKVTHCDMVPDSNMANEKGGGVYILTVEPLYSQIGNSKSLKCLYVPTVSNLLLDRFLIDKLEYSASVYKPVLVVSCPIRMLIGHEDTHRDGTGEWIEGSIYHINQDYRVNPYNSVHVIWLEQEAGTNQWVYEYGQMNNLVSPWDIELSAYYLMENVSAPKLPRSLMVGKLTALSVILYINSLDYAEPFKIELHNVPEYCQMFPDSADQLDLPSIMIWYHQGRYCDGDINGMGITLLLNDIQQMIRNGLKYNQCNQFFLPYRLCDALQKWVQWFICQLLKYHGSKNLKVYAETMGAKLQTESASVSTSTNAVIASSIPNSCKVVSPALVPVTKCSSSEIVKKINKNPEKYAEEEIHSQFIEV